jgi:hypothetical protein
MRTSGGISASRVPSGSVCTSEPARCQYSLDDCVCITFGAVFDAWAFRKTPSVRPVSGSISSP